MLKPKQNFEAKEQTMGGTMALFDLSLHDNGSL